MYFCSSFDIPATNAYLSRIIGKRAVTLRNTLDGVRAFNNVCLHRNSLIDPPGSGNRAFRCNYHGWSYDANGTLSHAPLSEVGTICDRQLQRYPTATSNDLFFLGARTHPDVSDVPLAFEHTEAVLAAPFAHGTLDHACNWKVLVENVLETYHLSFVHRDTFLPAGFSSTADYQFDMKAGVAWSTLTPKPQDKQNKAEKYRRISKSAGHYYRHAFIFPNLFLVNSNGLIGFLSSLYPIDSGKTRLEWSLFELPALATLASPIREHLRKDAIEFANATLLEDKALVESCQIGLSSVGNEIQFQPTEGRIAHFHSMYFESMLTRGM